MIFFTLNITFLNFADHGDYLMKKFISISSGVFLGMLSFSSFSADDDGCWSGKHSSGSCLEYFTYVKNKKTYFELTDVCDQRLYMSWSAGSKGGADSLKAGQTKKKYEYITGAYNSAKATGSNRPSKDWVCAGKVLGWSD